MENDSKIEQAQQEVIEEVKIEKIPEKKSEIDELKEENTKIKDQLLRLAAEFDNFRKRTDREKEEAGTYAITKFARDMIEVLENLHRAEASLNTEQLDADPVLKQIYSGVELTKKLLTDAFDKYEIKRIDPIGQQFNHDFHQAISQIQSSTHKEGEVVQVIQAGYVLKDRLLRPALVAVAKN